MLAEERALTSGVLARTTWFTSNGNRFENLHSDPHFQNLLRRIGLTR